MKLIYAILVFTVSVFSLKNADGADLSDEQHSSLAGLVKKVASQHSQIDTIVNPAGEKAVDYRRIQLGYVILFLVKNGIVGTKVDALFELIKSDLNTVTLPHHILFADENEQLLNSLMRDSENNYSPDSKISFSPVAPTAIGRKRSFAMLIYEAQIRLEKHTEYRFKNKHAVMSQ